MTPIRWSHLRAMALSPAHYQAACTTPRPDTPALRLGRLVHQLVLEGHRPCIFDGARRAGREWEAFAAEHEGEEIYRADELAQALPIAAAVRRDPLAVQALDGEREKRLTWRINGRECAGTPDVVGPGGLADLKTTSTAHPERFPPHAIRMLYHAQCAWYLHGLGLDAPARIVAVETKPPYAVTVFRLSPKTLEEGHKTWRLFFERVVGCEESEQWPAYAQSEVPIDLIDVALTYGADDE